MRRFSFALLMTAFLLPACYDGETREEFAQDIHVSDELVDFGMVPTGGAASQVVRVHNAGDFDLEFSQVPYVIHETGHETFSMEATWTPEEGDEEGQTVVRIPPRSYEEMTVTFSPVAEEDSYAYIGLYTNDTDEANRIVVLKGSSYTGTPMAYVTPSLVEYGFVANGNVAEQVVEIWNVGDVDVVVVDVTVGGSESPFEVMAIPAYPIPPGGQALVPVQFTSEGGDHEIASLTVEIEGELATDYVVNLSANSPGSTNNSPPQLNWLDPTEPTLFYLYQDLYLLARAFDAQQPNIGLYCNLESNVIGIIEQETSDSTTSEVVFVIDIDDSDFEDALGVHTLEMCCTDVFNESTCITTVISIDQPFSVDDMDGDGYDPAQGDSNDGDPTIYPGAIELPDGVDNDSDGTIDEETELYDDDGDGWPEVNGDCDDTDPDINPDATEEPDFFDNDCDGTIDEGTDYFDDDYDGFSEALGDCNDTDPDIYRGALEWCDQKDNDCDGDTDEDCIDDTPPLFVVGGVQADVVVATFEDSVELCLTVISGPDAELVFDWQASGGTFDPSPPDDTLPCATWIAPDVEDDYTVFCQVTDLASDQSAWAFLEITVQRTLQNSAKTTKDNTTCAVDGAQTAAPGVAAVFGSLVVLMGLRRRR